MDDLTWLCLHIDNWSASDDAVVSCDHLEECGYSYWSKDLSYNSDQKTFTKCEFLQHKKNMVYRIKHEGEVFNIYSEREGCEPKLMYSDSDYWMVIYRAYKLLLNNPLGV